MKNGSNHESEDIQSKAGRQKLTGKKVSLGVLMFLILTFAGVIFESLRGSFAFFVWMVLVISLAKLNSALCRKWLSLDRLGTYKYSWREFGLILLFFYVGRYGSGATPSMSQNLSVAIAMYLFLGYLMFYLSDRYVKRRVLNVALKSIPFVIFIVSFLVVSGILQSTRPKAVRYLDVNSGEVFEIAVKDIEKEFSILGEVAKLYQALDSYSDALDGYWEGTIGHQTLMGQASRIEGSWDIRVANIDSRVQEIESQWLRNMMLDWISSVRENFSAYVRIKEGLKDSDSTAFRIWQELANEDYSGRLELVKKYSSVVRVEPGDQLDEQRGIGLLRVQCMRIESTLNRYESAVVDLLYDDLAPGDFRQKKDHYESVLTGYFQKCDSLMKCLRNPEQLVILRDYLNYDDIYGSVPYQKVRALSSLASAYVSQDTSALSANYTKYVELGEESEKLLADFFSSFLR